MIKILVLGLSLAILEIPTCFNSQPGREVPKPTSTTFVNPLLAEGGDPWVTYKDGFYYAMVSPVSGLFGKDHVPISIWKTAKMSDLGSTQPTEVWATPDAGRKSAWAPELHFLDGKWYLYYASGPGLPGDQRMWVLQNENPDPTKGVWTDRGRLHTPGGDYYAIDGSVLNHPNGKRYFLWSGQDGKNVLETQLYIAEMENPWTLKSPRVTLSRPVYEWERIGKPLPLLNEGPEALVRGENVFIVYSASGNWTDDYTLGMLASNASSNPLDSASWKKSDKPVFIKNPEGCAYGPGHNGFFKSVNGTEDWIIYHAKTKPSDATVFDNLGGEPRSIRMQKFTFEQGTPVFGKAVSIFDLQVKPAGE